MHISQASIRLPTELPTAEVKVISPPACAETTSINSLAWLYVGRQKSVLIVIAFLMQGELAQLPAHSGSTREHGGLNARQMRYRPSLLLAQPQLSGSIYLPAGLSEAMASSTAVCSPRCCFLLILLLCCRRVFDEQATHLPWPMSSQHAKKGCGSD